MTLTVCPTSLLSETEGPADDGAFDLSGSVHPDWLSDLPGCAHLRVPEGRELVYSGGVLLRGRHPHHRWLRGLRTR